MRARWQLTVTTLFLQIRRTLCSRLWRCTLLAFWLTDTLSTFSTIDRCAFHSHILLFAVGFFSIMLPTECLICRECFRANVAPTSTMLWWLWVTVLTKQAARTTGLWKTHGDSGGEMVVSSKWSAWDLAAPMDCAASTCIPHSLSKLGPQRLLKMLLKLYESTRFRFRMINSSVNNTVTCIFIRYCKAQNDGRVSLELYRHLFICDLQFFIALVCSLSINHVANSYYGYE